MRENTKQRMRILEAMREEFVKLGNLREGLSQVKERREELEKEDGSAPKWFEDSVQEEKEMVWESDRRVLKLQIMFNEVRAVELMEELIEIRQDLDELGEFDANWWESSIMIEHLEEKKKEVEEKIDDVMDSNKKKKDQLDDYEKLVEEDKCYNWR